MLEYGGLDLFTGWTPDSTPVEKERLVIGLGQGKGFFNSAVVPFNGLLSFFNNQCCFRDWLLESPGSVL